MSKKVITGKDIFNKKFLLFPSYYNLCKQKNENILATSTSATDTAAATSLFFNYYK